MEQRPRGFPCYAASERESNKWVRAEHAAGRLAHDSGGDAGEYAKAVADALQRASTDAETLGAAFESAREASSILKTMAGITRT